MNVYLMVDLEGISGIYCPDQVMSDGHRLAEGRAYMTADINACVEACKEAGVDKVYVRDCHGGSNTLIYDQLTPLADYAICGSTGNNRFAGLEDCDAVILLGYHAMAGTPAAILEHSMSSKGVQNYWVNGRLVGETAIDAAIVGERGKPVIMVSGDDKVCAEAREFLPWVVTCEVKRALNCFGGMLLPQAKAHALIKEKTREAIAAFDTMKPYVIDHPVVMRQECVERGQVPSTHGKPYMRVIDGRTYEVEAATMEEALFRL
ncbi:MAG: hypothetical protein E7463_00215 [Ruminococcaceae bacterium]|nr:hypothetical protein [Oscillospiraceae bacterium]